MPPINLCIWPASLSQRSPEVPLGFFCLCLHQHPYSITPVNTLLFQLSEIDLPTPTPMLPPRCRRIPQSPLPRKAPLPRSPSHDRCAGGASGRVGKREPKLCSETKSQTWAPSSPLGPPTCVHTAASPSTYHHPHPEVSPSMPLCAREVAKGRGRLVKGDPCSMECRGGQQIDLWEGPWHPDTPC